VFFLIKWPKRASERGQKRGKRGKPLPSKDAKDEKPDKKLWRNFRYFPFCFSRTAFFGVKIPKMAFAHHFIAFVLAKKELERVGHI